MAVKTPQDHKTPKAEIDAAKQERFEDVEGSDLLRPFSKVKASDQMRLMGRLIRLGIFDESGDAAVDVDSDDFDLSSFDFEALADFTDYVAARFAVDSVKFDEFATGKDAMMRVMHLVIAYAGELGNDDA